MTKYTGKGVYGAVAMGKISVFKKQDTAIKRIQNCPSVPRKTTPPTAASTAPPYSFTTAAISYTPAINCRTFPSPATTPVPITNKIPPIPYSSMICSILFFSFTLHSLQMYAVC